MSYNSASRVLKNKNRIILTDETHEDDAEVGDFVFQATSVSSNVNFDLFTKTKQAVNNRTCTKMSDALKDELFLNIFEMIVNKEKRRDIQTKANHKGVY